MDESATATQQRRLGEYEKQSIYTVLSLHSANGKPRYGDVSQQAQLYGVSTRTIQRVWTKGAEGNGFKTVIPKRRKPSEVAALQDRVSKLPFLQKMDIRTMAEALLIPKTTLHRRFKNGELVRKHSSLKPMLSEDNVKKRLQYALSFANVVDGSVEFNPMLDRVFLESS
ncbi:hypothetical protein DYB26_014316, partial [Aphanomyces astaci]